MTEHQLIEAVRRACVEAALAAYQDAGGSGLCAEGRWEAAVGALQSLDLQRVAAEARATPSGPGSSNVPATARAGQRGHAAPSRLDRAAPATPAAGRAGAHERDHDGQ